MRIHYIQNDPIVTLGFIEEWANKKGYFLSSTRMYKAESLPSVNDFDFLIILGGRMGAYEEEHYPWLDLEKAFIHEAIRQDKGVLGICLGAQMIANVLGSKVYPHSHKEIGWWPVEVTHEDILSSLLKNIPKEFPAFEYHEDTFDLPEGAIRIASSEGCQNQAFSFGEKVIGLQFHPEFNEATILKLQENFDSEKHTGKFIQNSSYWVSETNLNKARTLLFTILDYFEKVTKKLRV